MARNKSRKIDATLPTQDDDALVSSALAKMGEAAQDGGFAQVSADAAADFAALPREDQDARLAAAAEMDADMRAALARQDGATDARLREGVALIPTGYYGLPVEIPAPVVHDGSAMLAALEAGAARREAAEGEEDPFSPEAIRARNLARLDAMRSAAENCDPNAPVWSAEDAVEDAPVSLDPLPPEEVARLMDDALAPEAGEGEGEGEGAQDGAEGGAEGDGAAEDGAAETGETSEQPQPAAPRATLTIRVMGEGETSAVVKAAIDAALATGYSATLVSAEGATLAVIEPPAALPRRATIARAPLPRAPRPMREPKPAAQPKRDGELHGANKAMFDLLLAEQGASVLDIWDASGWGNRPSAFHLDRFLQPRGFNLFRKGRGNDVLYAARKHGEAAPDGFEWAKTAASGEATTAEEASARAVEAAAA